MSRPGIHGFGALLAGVGQGVEKSVPALIEETQKRKEYERQLTLLEAMKRRLAEEDDTRQAAIQMAKDRDLYSRAAMNQWASNLPYVKGYSPELGARALELLGPTVGQGAGSVEAALASLKSPISPYTPGLAPGVAGPGSFDTLEESQAAAAAMEKSNRALSEFLGRPVEKKGTGTDKPVNYPLILKDSQRRAKEALAEPVAVFEKWIGDIKQTGESWSDFVKRNRPANLTKSYIQAYIAGTSRNNLPGQFPTSKLVNDALGSDYDEAAYQREVQARPSTSRAPRLDIPALLSTSPFAESAKRKGLTIY